MSLVVSSTRRGRRRWAVLAAAMAGVAGAYFSYRLYTSEAWARRRRQMVRMVSALSLLGDAAQQGAESAALISSDLKRFLLSDDDDLPRSLRQALKITHSPDFQHSCTLLSAALTRGLLRGLASPPPPPPSTPLNTHRSNIPPEDPCCKEIKEICLVSSPGSQKGRVQRIEESDRDWQEWEVKTYTSGSRREGSTIGSNGRRQQQIEGKPAEELPERLLGKLFSEPGVNFASSVVGNLASNIVKAVFDGFDSQAVTHTKPGEEGEAASFKVVDVLCTQHCRGLITECIQTLVSTAVSVYVDRTKDVNFYNDMVAGITNPSHKGPMKDLLTAVCNGAVETLVKSSHNVVFAKKSQLGSERSGQYSQQEQWAVEEMSDGPHDRSQLSLFSSALSASRQNQGQGMTKSVDGHVCTSSCISEICEPSAPLILKPNMEDILEDSERQAFGETSQRPQRDNSGVQSFIDGVSKTLAIPSNRKLVVDVAGTMTSEAVRSFVDVVVSTVSSNLHDKMRRGWGFLQFGASEQVGNSKSLQCAAKHKDMAIKAFLLASICLAICLHMLTGIYVTEKV